MRPAFARLDFPPALDTDARPNWPLAATAQHTLLAHVRRLLSLRDAAYDGDAEAIRRVRVAARRARSALADFGLLWDAHVVRDVRRALGRLVDRLGAVRDVQVTLALAADVAAAGDARLSAALAALQRRHERAQPAVHAALRAFELDGWPARLVTYFASRPLDLWRFVDLQDLLHDGEGTPDP